MSGIYGRNYAKDEDFDEGEVWGVMEESSNNSSRKPFKESCLFSNNNYYSSPSSRQFSAARMIPKSSTTATTTDGVAGKQSSAPVDIPDWSKIYGKSSPSSKKKKNGLTSSLSTSSSSWAINYNEGGVGGGDGMHGMNNGCYNYNGHQHHHHHVMNGYNDGDGDGDDDGDDDGIDGMVPPHEYLARKLARSQISSFSVYEGIGRTLKGRDLSKVRNTILSKTGFLE